jgi:hypothetical protein
MKPTIILSALLLTTIAGCGTPQAVINQAEDGVAVTAELDSELRDFIRAENLSEQAVLDSATAQKKIALRLTRANASNDLASVATGDASVLTVIAQGDKYLKELAQLDEASAASMAEVTSASGKVLTPLPSTTEALTNTQAKFAEFGKKLSTEVRAAEFQTILAAVRKVAKDNKEKMSEASKTTAPAPLN